MCRMVGDLPCLHILITASLSSSNFSVQLFDNGGRFAGTKSTSKNELSLVFVGWTIALSWVACFEKTSVINDHKSIDGSPSTRRHVSSAITSASVELCDTAPCFLQSPRNGANVLGPIKHNIPPVVDLLSRISPANPASANKSSWHSLGWSPTKLVTV